MLLLLAPPALAHRPHSVVVDFAAAEDFATSGRAWAIEDPFDISQLRVSTDGGRHWGYQNGDLVNDDLTSLRTAGGRIYVGSEQGRLWSSTDGVTWESMSLGSPIRWLDAAGSTIAARTDNALWIGDAEAGTLEAIVGGTFGAIRVDPEESGRLLAAGAEGFWEGGADGGVWSTLPDEAAAVSLAVAGDTVYLGTEAGIWRREADTWTACDALPVAAPELEWSNGAWALFAEGEEVLAATGREALFRSEDACASWDRVPTGLAAEYGVIGYAANPAELFRRIERVDGTWFVAGYDGVGRSEDGVSWTLTPMLPSDYARGLAFALDWPADPRIWYGGYGGGVAWTEDGGQTWGGSAVGTGDMVYAYDVQPASSGDYYSGNDAPFRSTDGGLTWTQFTLDKERVRTFRPGVGRDWALGESIATGEVEGALWRSSDGESWEAVSLPGESEPRDIQEVQLADGEHLLLLGDRPAALMSSLDDGVSWQTLWSMPADEPAAGLAAWPPGAATRLVVGSLAGGVVISDDIGETWASPEVAPSGTIRLLTMADDGTLFALTRVGQVWRSEDGGDRWEAVGERIPYAAEDLQTAPGFEDRGWLLIATMRGLWWSSDRGDTWHPAPRYERLEDLSFHLTCLEGGLVGAECTTYADDGDGAGGGWALVPGDVITLSTEQTMLEVIGHGELLFGVEVDGVDAGLIEGVLELDGEWHDVRLTALAELGLDRIDAWGPGEVIDEPTTEGEGDDTGHDGDSDTATHDTASPDEPDPPRRRGTDGRCGCDHAGGAWLLVALGLRRRVARPGPPRDRSTPGGTAR